MLLADYPVIVSGVYHGRPHANVGFYGGQVGLEIQQGSRSGPVARICTPEFSP